MPVAVSVARYLFNFINENGPIREIRKKRKLSISAEAVGNHLFYRMCKCSACPPIPPHNKYRSSSEVGTNKSFRFLLHPTFRLLVLVQEVRVSDAS